MFNQDFSENKDSLYDAEKMSQEDRRVPTIDGKGSQIR